MYTRLLCIQDFDAYHNYTRHVVRWHLPQQILRALHGCPAWWSTPLPGICARPPYLLVLNGGLRSVWWSWLVVYALPGGPAWWSTFCLVDCAIPGGLRPTWWSCLVVCTLSWWSCLVVCTLLGGPAWCSLPYMVVCTLPDGSGWWSVPYMVVCTLPVGPAW